MDSSVEFERWRAAVDQHLFDLYIITLADAGIDDDRLESFWRDDWSPQKFVEWFGEKYDLIARKAFSL